MASHPSVTRCDVRPHPRHIVTSRHTPLRGVTDVTCDAGAPGSSISPTGVPSGRTRTEPYQWRTSTTSAQFQIESFSSSTRQFELVAAQRGLAACKSLVKL